MNSRQHSLAETAPARIRLAALAQELRAWLKDSAYDLWARNGIDPRNGGFIETVSQHGVGLPHPRRARIHPRQIHAFAQAPALGWAGDAASIVTRGTEYFEARYRRSDGLFRTLAGVDGEPLDERVLLYDQAFALLGYSAASATLAASNAFEQRALALFEAIERIFGTGDDAFRSNETRDGPFESNPHMHLLEACMAWAEIGSDPQWSQRVDRLVQLALRRFIRADSGALGEAYATDWSPALGVAGRIIEPGHQFEWAWLLLRAENHDPALRKAALRLIDIGELHGVHNQVAINALLDDFSIHDQNARFWPQTERLKAALLAARLTGDDRYWEMAAAAAASFLPYLATPVKGLWLDVRLPTGELVDSPAPASTFYHVVGAIAVLEASLR